MDAGEQTLTLLSRIWMKLQNLPKANDIELGAFFVLLIFILVIVLMVVLTCLTCCSCCPCCPCCRKNKTKNPTI